jgi:molybdenum cofactor cytidylyltransferase
MIALRDEAVRRNPLLPRHRSGLWTVVLAAGGARRFGRHKLLLRIGTDSLRGRSVACAEAVTPGRCVVVLGCRASRLRAALRGQRVHVAVNPRWRSGMASSLQAGLSAVPPDAAAVLVLLADQYAIGPADLNRLVSAWSGDRARPAAAVCEGRPSAPAILPRSWFPKVMMLRGDEGARRLIRGGAEGPIPVPMPIARLDLDDRRALAGFRRIARRAGPAWNRTLAPARAGRYIR